MPKTGIIIANTGSPSEPAPEAVEAYLKQFLMDPRIRQLPKPVWKFLLKHMILPNRKFSSAKRYQQIWTEEGSPLICIQERIARQLQNRFDAEGSMECIVLSGMSYGTPSVAERLEQLRDQECERVVLLPLYPQSAYSPTLAVVDSFQRALSAMGWNPETLVIDNYHDHEGYIDLVAKSIQAAGFDPQGGDRLLLSWHAIPLKDERNGDTYRTQIAESVDLIAQRLGMSAEDITVGFQSVFGHNPDAWVSPLSLNILKSWSGKFHGRVFFMNPGFSVDCLETLYDIPNEMEPALTGIGSIDYLAAGGVAPCADPSKNDGQVPADKSQGLHPTATMVVVGCLNDSPEHVDVLFDVLKRNLKENR